MAGSFWQVILCLLAGIALIVILTAKYRLPPFFALIAAALVVGAGVGLPIPDVIAAMRDGFGNIMKSLGLIIVMGTTLGVLLEHSGSVQTMAHFIVTKVGQRNAPIAMSLTGFVVGLPIFCDSGYIVLNGLNKSLSRQTRIPVTIMAVSMATGLYSVHCLIPPHPGATAAAGTLGVEVGKLIGTGAIVAIPAMLAGYAWAKYMGSKEVFVMEEEEIKEVQVAQQSVFLTFLPVLVPVLLIAFKSFLTIETSKAASFPISVFNVLGDPVIALLVGIGLAFLNIRKPKQETVSSLLGEAVEKGGGMLVIIGAGGAFGGVLAATKIGAYFIHWSSMSSWGILLPFLITAFLKTAQGSSTVAIITAASIVQPLLPLLALTTDKNKLLCVLAMGAGSMMISHANDAYFWVIAKFSGLSMQSLLKVYSVATLLMGIVSLIMVYLLSFLL